MKKGQEHPASYVSKNLLTKGLLLLLNKTPYSSITITQLCKHSDIARRTFYRNFSSIDEVLSYYIGDIIKEFEQEMQRHSEKKYHDMITAYFAFWLKYADFLAILNKNNLTHLLFTPYIMCLFRMPFLINVDTKKVNEEAAFSCKLAYTAGGLWSVLSYWSLKGCVETPMELADILVAN